MRAARSWCPNSRAPYLFKADNPHILMLSPPLDMKEKWFARHTAYSMAKFGMSLVVLGLAGEFRSKGVAVNALWPRTTIATAAVKNLLGGDALMRASRKPEILADAAHLIFSKPAREFTGRFLIDDTFLAENGVTEFDQYRVDPTQRSRGRFLRARRQRRARAAHATSGLKRVALRRNCRNGERPARLDARQGFQRVRRQKLSLFRRSGCPAPGRGIERPPQGNENIGSISFNRLWRLFPARDASLTLTIYGSVVRCRAPPGSRQTQYHRILIYGSKLSTVRAHPSTARPG